MGEIALGVPAQWKCQGRHRLAVGRMLLTGHQIAACASRPPTLQVVAGLTDSVSARTEASRTYKEVQTPQTGAALGSRRTSATMPSANAVDPPSTL